MLVPCLWMRLVKFMSSDKCHCFDPANDTKFVVTTRKTTLYETYFISHRFFADFA